MEKFPHHFGASALLSLLVGVVLIFFTRLARLFFFTKAETTPTKPGEPELRLSRKELDKTLEVDLQQGSSPAGTEALKRPGPRAGRRRPAVLFDRRVTLDGLMAASVTLLVAAFSLLASGGVGPRGEPLHEFTTRGEAPGFENFGLEHEQSIDLLQNARELRDGTTADRRRALELVEIVIELEKESSAETRRRLERLRSTLQEELEVDRKRRPSSGMVCLESPFVLQPREGGNDGIEVRPLAAILASDVDLVLATGYDFLPALGAWNRWPSVGDVPDRSACGRGLCPPTSSYLEIGDRSAITGGTFWFAGAEHAVTVAVAVDGWPSGWTARPSDLSWVGDLDSLAMSQTVEVDNLAINSHGEPVGFHVEQRHLDRVSESGGRGGCLDSGAEIGLSARPMMLDSVLLTDLYIHESGWSLSASGDGPGAAAGERASTRYQLLPLAAGSPVDGGHCVAMPTVEPTASLAVAPMPSRRSTFLSSLCQLDAPEKRFGGAIADLSMALDFSAGAELASPINVRDIGPVMIMSALEGEILPSSSDDFVHAAVRAAGRSDGAGGVKMSADGTRQAETSKAASLDLAGRQRALIIGIDDYVDWDFAALGHATGDAQSMREILAGKGYDTEMMLDAAATEARILETLESWVEQSRDGDTAVVYFAGHGFSDAAGRQAVVTADGHALSLAELQRVLDRHRGSVSVVIDACSDLRELRPERLRITESLNQSRRVRFFLGSEPGGWALESEKLGGGLYTHAILEGLERIEGDVSRADLNRVLEAASERAEDQASTLYGVRQVPTVAVPAP